MHINYLLKKFSGEAPQTSPMGGCLAPRILPYPPRDIPAVQLHNLTTACNDMCYKCLRLH